MITIISPAKSMNFDAIHMLCESLKFAESVETKNLLKILQTLSQKQIAKIMNVSEKIAELNYQRFQSYSTLPEKPAIFAYTGDVYKNINTETMQPEMLNFAQRHLRILSALYGMVRPMDKIKAYRLEMVAKLPKIAASGMSAFWKDNITCKLNEELERHHSQFLINLASNEYGAAVDQSKLIAPVINVHFREIRDTTLKNIALNSKRARGMMADYIIRNSLDLPEQLKSFQAINYAFDKNLSDQRNFFFVR